MSLTYSFHSTWLHSHKENLFYFAQQRRRRRQLDDEGFKLLFFELPSSAFTFAFNGFSRVVRVLGKYYCGRFELMQSPGEFYWKVFHINRRIPSATIKLLLRHNYSLDSNRRVSTDRICSRTHNPYRCLLTNCRHVFNRVVFDVSTVEELRSRMRLI